MNLAGSQPKRAYFIGQRGWLDLLGSIPSFGFIPFTALFRLARLSRLARITRLMRGQAGKDLVIDVLENRGQYATFITILLAGIVLSRPPASSSSSSRAARRTRNITTGGDAIWWGIVTITTVGYGDYYPVTMLGRITGVFVMFAGIGIIGALASILASLLVSPPAPEEPAPDEPRRMPTCRALPPRPVRSRTSSAGLRAEVAGQRAEIAALRASLADRAG